MALSKNADRKIFRLVAILNKMDSGANISTSELAAEFGVSVRSIQRDLDLLNCTGFLITEVSRGVYAFADGFSLKKMKLTDEEASLLSFFNEIASSLGANFQKSFGNIMHKVIQQDYTSPFYVKIPHAGMASPNLPFVKELEDAIENTNKIQIRYEKKEGEKSYLLCPLKLTFFQGFWYLLAQDEKRPGIFKFRMDSIKEVEILGKTFCPPSNLQTMLEQSVNVWFDDKRPIVALLQIDKGVAKFFRQKVYFPVQKIKKEEKDGSLILETRVNNFMEIIPTILEWMPNVIVQSPVELKAQIKDKVEAYAKLIKG